jgi:hypothetical protein
MARTKITARLNANLADALSRVARIDDRSVSDVVEDAVSRYFERAHSEAEHHALMAKLDRLSLRLGSIERNQETLFELTAHVTRFAMSVAPEIPERDKPAVNARGSERFRNVIAAIVSRLASGKSVWRENFAAAPVSEPHVMARQGAAGE